MSNKLVIFLFSCFAIFNCGCTINNNNPSVMPLLTENIIFLEDVKWILYCLNWDTHLQKIGCKGFNDTTVSSLSLNLVLNDISIDPDGGIIYTFKYEEENALIVQTFKKLYFLRVKVLNGIVEPISISNLTFDFTANPKLLKRKIKALEDSLKSNFNDRPEIYNNWLSEKIKKNYTTIIFKD